MINMKKIALTSLLSSTLMIAGSYEYPSVYKDTRIMGMGGANVAVGGESAAMFYNPAGLSRLDPDDGVEVELFNLNIAFSADTIDFITEVSDAEDETAMIESLEAYYGQNNHLTFNDYSSVSYRGEQFAWSIGVLAGLQGNFQAHTLSHPSGIVEINAIVTGALVAGIAYDVNDYIHVGTSLKVYQGAGVAKGFDYGDIDGIDADTLTDGAEFSATTVDLGVIYDLEGLSDIVPFSVPFEEVLHPAVGLSVMSIGGAEFGQYGTMPMTFNLGLSIEPEIPVFQNWVFAMDYIDMFNAYGDEYDRDAAKRIRLGAHFSLFDNQWVEASLSTGMYNAAYTFGAELRLGIFDLAYSTYAEAIGAYASQNLDRRHQIMFNIGW